MTKKYFYLSIVSIEKKIFSAKAKYLKVMGIKGGLGISPGHAPLLTIIKPGILHIVTEHKEKKYITILGGILEVKPTEVTILANSFN